MKAGRMYYTNGVRDRESEAKQEGFEVGIEQGLAEGRRETVRQIFEDIERKWTRTYGEPDLIMYSYDWEALRKKWLGK